MSLPHFGVTKPVPARLLMMILVIGGVYAALTIRREFFPETDPDALLISMPFPGASPQEVEESMARKVEDAIVDVEGVDELETTLTEGMGRILVKLEGGADVKEAKDDMEQAVDLLEDLPEESKEIRITEMDPQMPVIMLTLHGAGEEEVMKDAIREIADDLRSLKGMGEVVMTGIRGYEISVDVNEAALIEHGISLSGVGDAIRGWMEDVPGGAARTEVGNVRVRTLGVEEHAEAVRQIVVKASRSGQTVRVGEIAEVRDAFVDEQLVKRFNGERAVSLTVFKTSDEDAIEMSQMVKAYATGRQGGALELTLWEQVRGSPKSAAYELGRSRREGLPGHLTTHSDLARFIEGRLDLLTENGLQGAVLIFLTILVFMSPKTAVWVVSGLVTAIAGTLLLMLIFGVTLNLLTMFGLLITLGMLEDDAIVVAENVTTRFEHGDPPMTAAVKGAEQVFWPVIGTVLTTVVAFLPLKMVEGRIGDLLGALPMVVMLSLVVSVVETMTMLPSHLAHSHEKGLRRQPGRMARWLRRYEGWRDGVVVSGVQRGYAKFLRLTLAHRYLAALTALGVLVMSMGMVAGGRLPFTFLPHSDSETIVVDVRMPIGTSLEETSAAAGRIEEAARAQPETQSVSTVVGQRVNVDTGMADESSSHLAQIFIELLAVELRERESSMVVQAIREHLGVLRGAEMVKYSEIGGAGAGPDLTVRVSGERFEEVEAGAAEVRRFLGEYAGVHDVGDDNYRSQRELQVTMRPDAAGLGFSVNEVARQLRGSLHGLEAHAYSAKRENIKVRVRLDEQTRRELGTIENLWMVNAEGRAVPLGEIAEISEGSGQSSIRRVNRERTITVTGSTSPGTNPEEIAAEVQKKIKELGAKNTGVRFEMAGRQRDLGDAFATLPTAYVGAMLMVYLILAWLFSSFTQPLVVMLAIPFGIIGVVWGHLLLGFELTFLSLIGFVALTGVVVNNSLIFIEFFNAKRGKGLELREALVQSGRERFRAIVLTSITTFFGLMPLVFEQSFQARFLIPMAISISFGLVSSTILTLGVLPCLIVILNDVQRVARGMMGGAVDETAQERVLAAPADTD